MSDAEVARWMAELGDLSADEAARSRSRERSLRQQAGEETAMADLLASFAERRAVTAFTTDAGRTITGVVLGVGRDFVAVTASRGRVTLVALARVATIGSRDPLPPTGDRPGEPGPRLAWALAALVGEDVSIAAGAGSAQGTLAFVGADVLGVRRAPGADLTYVPLSSVSEVSVAEGSLSASG